MNSNDKINENTEDFNIDFKKIFSFFKKKEADIVRNDKKSDASIPAHQEVDNNSSISFDVRKIKNFFKKTVTSLDSHNNQENDSETIDFGRIKSILFKHQVLFLLLLVLIIQFIPNAGFWPWGGIWMRMQT